MNNNILSKRVVVSIFTAIIIIMTIIPNLGYIYTPWVRITVIHVPVIVVSILYGKSLAIFMGIIFAVSSLLINTFNPNILSFLFSPFYKFGEIGGGMASLIICFIPRIIMAIVASILYRKNCKKVYLLFLGFISSLCNTFFVLLGIYIFYFDEFIKIKNIPKDGAYVTIALLLSINGILEAIVAGILVSMIIPKLKKFI